MGEGNANVKYGAIMADPPWPQGTIGQFARRQNQRLAELPYTLMTLEAIARLQVPLLASETAILWLWTTNSHLRSAFDVLDAWGAKYLTTLTWVKPSGFGAYFANTTQHLLVGYWGKCRLKKKWEPTNYEWVPRGHSRKPDHAYRLVERVSYGPYLELFARERRFG